ncbi:U2 small nuclear ribonucleoprotein B [Quillaja saponaria]|uniref:U2 small nuclear ribonucleoprotein B n=1 Tax=Quillaja saponaria TaxID=32244 RepID=A0AAD7LVP3_QUISA|nr:U2 small nuclear ribonucleoprotein B [Quillaja saponaria]
MKYLQAAASHAVRQMQSFPFYDKPMWIHYAKTKSDCVAKEDGSYVPRSKKKKSEAQQSSVANDTASNGGSTASFRQGKPNAPEAAAPNNIMFIENLPHETTSRMLEMLFKQYPGFKEVPLIEASQLCQEVTEHTSTVSIVLSSNPFSVCEVQEAAGEVHAGCNHVDLWQLIAKAVFLLFTRNLHAAAIFLVCSSFCKRLTAR